MLQRIVMPTDGSPESELPLKLVAELASAHDAVVTVIRVLEHEAEANTDAVHTQLAGMQARLEAANVSTSVVTIHGHPADALLDHLQHEHSDLVVMATHGRTGLKRITMGSVTDRIVREGPVPLLVTRVFDELPASLERVLVLLDGSPLAEQVLPLVRTLVGRPVKRIKLLWALAEWVAYDTAQEYLKGVAHQLADTGISTEVVVQIGGGRPDVFQAEADSDFVALCTHGRGGVDRLLHGSVAQEIIREGTLPILIVRGKPGNGTD